MSEKKRERKAETAADPTKPFREMYNQFWKQAEGQWDQLLRNPQFLAAMAAGREQSENMVARVQEITATSLKTMNIPTRDDIEALARRLDEISRQIVELGRKIDKMSAPTGAKKASTRKRPSVRAKR